MCGTAPVRLSARLLIALALIVAEARGRFMTVPAPVVNCSAGAFVPYEMLSSDGRPFWAFSGIRYAKAPRFEAPEPADIVEGIQNAFKEGEECLQFERVNKTIIGSEDCLFLNIYTHNVERKAPVMLWIHGGAWKYGSSSKFFYGPDFLMNEDIVLVTINYRLGPLGFASLENDVLPGNMGLKDQEEGVRWVKQNIAAFGGDPDGITLFGQSAGGASVSFHMKGRVQDLIRGGIAQSGCSLSPWAVGRNNFVRNSTLEVAGLAGCKVKESDDTEIRDCLMNKTGEELIKAVQDLPLLDQEKLPFRPVIEPDGPVPVDPWDEPPSHLPYMAGYTSDEGAFFVALLMKGGDFVIAMINKAFNRIAPEMFMFDSTAANPAEVAQQIHDFYTGNEPFTKFDVKPLVDMMTDAWFAHPIRSEIEQHQGPVYSYVFDYLGAKTLYDVFNVSDQFRFGPGHIEDVPYIFRAQPLDLLAEGTYEDLLKSKEIIKMWTNFAHGVDPTPNVVEGSGWLEKSKDGGYLVISKNASKIVDRTTDKSEERERLDFWSELPYRQPSTSKKPDIASSRK
ncbi:Esterase [Nesidiocoris tenuis]|uniref:Carboxylic ester hydrolase n=1 Tax=Nesidiocoris tenuis TaxID=355587 RepID=A0ABN7B7C0_9HEMI|nr:Esterase [Nesidiocoris tenuis]